MDDCIAFFNTFLKTELKPFMKEKGFKTSGQHFYIEKEDFTVFISIEKSSWNMKDSFSFWLKASVFDKIAYKYLGEYSTITKIPHNTLFNIISTSVIALQEEKTDTYHLTPNSDIQIFRDTIFDHLERILIPFAENLNSSGLLELYKTPPKGFIGPGIFMNLAIGYRLIESGDKKQGIQHIKNWITEEQKRGYWNDLVDSMEKKLLEDKL